MEVTLILVGFPKQYAGVHDRLELAAGPTVAEMLQAAGIPMALVAAVVRGNTLVPIDYRPQDGERIKVIAMIGGG